MLMAINLRAPDFTELKPRIVVFGVGGAGGNAVNNMVESALDGVEFVVANTDAQAIANSRAMRRIQLGNTLTQGLGAGSRPEVGAAAAEESLEDIREALSNAHMVFITAGMGGGTGTGAAPVIARAARDLGILTVGVVTKPFAFEGQRRMRAADEGIHRLQACVDTLIVIPNQNLFRVANEKTTFAKAFAMADDVLYSGVRGVTDLMVMPGLINLDFADVRTVMIEMGKAMMGTGEADGQDRAQRAAEAAISNPLLDHSSMKGAKGVLINITGGDDLTLYEVDEAANKIRAEVDPDANIIVGSTFDERLQGKMRVSVVATGIDSDALKMMPPKPVAEMARSTPAATPAAASPAPAHVAAVNPVHALQAEIAQTHSAQQQADADERILADARQIAARVAADQGALSALPGSIAAGRTDINATTLDLSGYEGSILPGMDNSRYAGRAIRPELQDAHADPKKKSALSILAELGRVSLGLGGVGKTEPQVGDPSSTRKAKLINADQGLERPSREMKGQRATPPAAGQAGPNPYSGSSGRLPSSHYEVTDDQLEIPAFLRRQSN